MACERRKTSPILRGVFTTIAVLGGLMVGLLGFARAMEHDRNPAPAILSCISAEECYREALAEVTKSAGDGIEAERDRAAIDRLKLVSKIDPDSEWSKRARLLSGVFLRDRDPDQALSSLEAARKNFPILDDYIRFWQAEALFNLGEGSKAATVFESIAQVWPDSLLRREAALRSGEAWYQADQCRKAIDQIQHAMSLEVGDRSTPTAWLKMADCQIREIRTAEGMRTLERVWARFPNSPEAKEAEARLHVRAGEGVWLPEAETILERADVLLELALYEEVVKDLETLLAAAPEHPLRDEARLKLGLALVRLKRYDEARELYQALLNERGDSAGTAAWWLARIYLRQGLGPQLLSLPELFPELALSNAKKASILFYAGVWLEDQGRHEEAIATFRRAAKISRASRAWARSLWRIGWIQYRNGSYQEAAKTFEEGLKGKELDYATPQFLYWTARSLEQLKDPGATEAYAQLCRRYPFTYYGQLLDSCEQASSVPSDSGSRPTGDANDIDDEALTLVRQSPHYHKALELKELGLKPEAAHELSWLTKQGFRARRVLLELAVRLQEVEAYHEALRVAKIYFRETLERGSEAAPPAFWSVAYPDGYLPTIKSYADGRVDPYLVAAIIREESLYDSHALSPAGAVGLMQLMPATAKTLTGRSDDLDVVRSELFDSQTNIRLGSYYLGKLVKQFTGNLMHVVASYNAGPKAVSRWIRRNAGAKPEEFVELIPYRETRGYVKRVLRSYREYHRLHNGGCGADSLDRVC